MKIAALSALSLSVLLAGCSHPRPVYYAPPPPPPPLPSPSAVYQQGFHDGFEAARRDVADGRPPRFDQHPRFRNPPVPPPAMNEYRHAFQDGYGRFLHQAPPPPGY